MELVSNAIVAGAHLDARVNAHEDQHLCVRGGAHVLSTFYRAVDPVFAVNRALVTTITQRGFDNDRLSITSPS
jgi:hypothetical protein